MAPPNPARTFGVIKGIGGGDTVTGDKKIDRKLKHLSTGGQVRVSRVMLAVLMKEFRRGIRNAVNAKYRDAKKTVGARHVKSKKNDEHGAKVGFGVGKPQLQVRRLRKRSDPKRPGLGIRASNIHWFILGTKDRFQKTTGRYTGRMPAFSKEQWLKRGFQSILSRALKLARAAGRKQVLREAQKA